jgi:hypothetical protein
MVAACAGTAGRTAAKVPARLDARNPRLAIIELTVDMVPSSSQVRADESSLRISKTSVISNKAEVTLDAHQIA